MQLEVCEELSVIYGPRGALWDCRGGDYKVILCSEPDVLLGDTSDVKLAQGGNEGIVKDEAAWRLLLGQDVCQRDAGFRQVQVDGSEDRL